MTFSATLATTMASPMMTHMVTLPAIMQAAGEADGLITRRYTSFTNTCPAKLICASTVDMTDANTATMARPSSPAGR